MNSASRLPEHVRLLGNASGDILRLFFVIGAVLSLACAAIIPFFGSAAQASQFRLVSVACACLAGAFAFIGWRLRSASLSSAMLAGCWSALVLVCVIGIARGEGLLALENFFFCMLICVVMPICGVRAGAVMTLFCTGWIGVLAYLEHAGWLSGGQAVVEAPLYLRLLTLSLVFATAFSGGFIVHRLLALAIDAVQAPERRYRALFDQLPAGVVLHRGDHIVDANAVAQTLLDDVDTWNDDHASASVRALLERTAPLAAQPVGSRLDATAVQIASTSGARVLQVSAVRVDGAEGYDTMAVFLDDSERHAATLEAERVHAQVRHLFDASPDCVLLTAGSILGPIRLANNGFLAAIDQPADAVLGRTLVQLGVWFGRAQNGDVLALESCQHLKEVVVMFCLGASGERAMQLSTNSFDFDGASYVVTFARDVTEKERLRLEQTATLAHAALGIALTRDAALTRVNEAFARLFAATPVTLSGHTLESLFVDAGTARDALNGAVAELGRGGEVDLECALRRLDGTTFWGRLRARAIDAEQPVNGEVWLIDDVTDRRRMQQALAVARDVAEQASHARSAFLANTSHEIRTPLNGLIGLSRLAMKADIDHARRRGYLEQILESALSLGHTMAGILDMSRIESGRLILEAIEFSPRATLHAVIDELGPRASRQGLGYALHVDEGVPECVTGDPLRLRQIIGNYYSNALKFTPAGAATIRAIWRADAQQTSSNRGILRVEVVDSGIGIDEAVLPRLFLPFMQVDASTTRRYGGVGLGLAICRELATLMGGSVGVESRVGRGSTFWLELPFECVARSSAARVEALAPVVDSRALIGRRILLADDNPVNLLLAAELLASWQVDVVQASDGDAAVWAVDAAAGSGRPIELVLMDLQMPRMDGMSASRVLRRRYGSRLLPIVALTAGESASERAEALASGMDAVLHKPIDERALERTLIALLSTTAGALQVAPTR